MHTKGPWSWQKSAGNHHGQIYDDETGKTLALTYDLKDAPIIAAAPQLLEALKMAWDQIVDMDHDIAHMIDDDEPDGGWIEYQQLLDETKAKMKAAIAAAE